MNPTTKILIIILSVLVTTALVVALFLIFLKSYRGSNRFLQFLRYNLFKDKTQRKRYDAYYSIKPRYITQCEEQYFEIIKLLIKPDYLIFPQIPLSQIIEKHSQSNYKTELFRTIDFCIFDKNYYPVLCIEINDSTHTSKNRAKRDSKVSEILNSARLPLLVLWTYERSDASYIKKLLKPYGVIK